MNTNQLKEEIENAMIKRRKNYGSSEVNKYNKIIKENRIGFIVSSKP